MSNSESRRFILIVDDGETSDLLATSSLKEDLEKKQIVVTVVTARDGAQALLKAENQKFDVVIVDMAAPRVGDRAFSNGLRNMKNLEESRLYALCEDIEAPISEALKAARTFVKPLNVIELITVLSSDMKTTVSQKIDGAKYTLDVRVINAIIAASVKVLAQFQMVDIKMGKPQMKNCEDPIGGEIASVLEINSQHFHGQLCISFDKNSFLELVSNMLGETQTEINTDNQDAVAEINNIIFGNAKSDLTQYGVSMSIPKVVHGNKNLQCPSGSAMMQVPFRSKRGSFFIEVVAHPVEKKAAS